MVQLKKEEVVEEEMMEVKKKKVWELVVFVFVAVVELEQSYYYFLSLEEHLDVNLREHFGFEMLEEECMFERIAVVVEEECNYLQNSRKPVEVFVAVVVAEEEECIDLLAYCRKKRQELV